MIPIFDVKIEIKVDRTKVCSPPPWRIIHEKNGLVGNHFYTYKKGIKWKDVAFVLTIEKEALELLDSQTKTEEEFETNVDKLLDSPEWEDESWNLEGLDLGIASVVFALYAFGCFPITSCRGHPPPCGERYPLVVFFAKPEIVPLIVDVATGTGVGLCNAECEGAESLMVYATNILDMQRFAVGLQTAASSINYKRTKKTATPKPE